jgi:hypothetical protein
MLDVEVKTHNDPVLHSVSILHSTDCFLTPQMLMKQCVHLITGFYEVFGHPVKLHTVKLLVKPSARIRMLDMEVRTHNDPGLLISIPILHIDRSFPRTTDACETMCCM